MVTYPQIDPVAISIGPLQVHWYGLMYLFGFVAAWWLGVSRAKKPNAILKEKQIEDLIFYSAVGLVLGARFGYVFFYKFEDFLQNPIWLFKVWEGGMSFHGGAIGVMLAMYLYSRKVKRHFVDIMDFVVPLAPMGLFFGRMGNFIGGELWGRVTDVPWGMVFPKDPGNIRHPSQLYEAFLEGIVLFFILLWFTRKPRPRFAASGVFLMGYGVFRFSVEFFREPDAHISFKLFGWMTRGQILTMPMILIGLSMLLWAYLYKTNDKTANVNNKKSVHN